MKCSTPHLTEDEIKDGSVKTLNQLIGNRDEILENAVIIRNAVDITEQLASDDTVSLIVGVGLGGCDGSCDAGRVVGIRLAFSLVIRHPVQASARVFQTDAL